MSGATEQFYDRFSSQFVRDYVRGNRRVDYQLAFLTAAIPAATSRALVIGCGSGDAARRIARLAADCRIVAVDLSGENVRLAQRLNPHPRVTYRKADVLEGDAEPSAAPFDVVVLPDVYEHIPLPKRAVLHRRLDYMLGADGRLVLTVPSPSKQIRLAAQGHGLQIVDEIVTADDLRTLARDLGGGLIYLNEISVWEPGDYLHAIVARGTARDLPIAAPRYPNPLAPIRDLVRAPFRSIYVRLRLRNRAAVDAVDGADDRA